MTLRGKVLTLFFLLAAAPLLGLGLFEYMRSMRAVEQLVSVQNARLAQRAAESIEARVVVVQSDVLVLAENAETQRWLAARDLGMPDNAIAPDAKRYLTSVWERIGSGYTGMELADARGQVVFGASRETGILTGAGPTWRAGPDPIEHPIHDLNSARLIGTLHLQPILEGLVPLSDVSTGFGERGVGMLVDRSTGRILWHPESSTLPRPASDVLGAEFVTATLADKRGSFRYRIGDTARIAAYAGIDAFPWTVVMTSATSDFAAPFAQVGQSTLILFVAVALLVTLAFSTMLRRTTRDLEALTGAAAVVGQGNFTPSLPPAGGDEVGQLSAAFGAMIARIRAMVEEIRMSRQMAVLGEFAAQLSHEIRNPLTSIKLNLQKVEREQREAPNAAATAVPLDIALREVNRLDRVVRGVLDLARPEGTERRLASVHALVGETVDVIVDQARQQGVSIELALDAGRHAVIMDPVHMKGAVLNVIINALEAMPSGGILRIGSSASDTVLALAISDTGPGIPLDRRSDVFRPFSTTKQSGTGLGLPLARRIVEEHGGTIAVDENPNGGARIMLTLPLSAESR
jgi:signal transduction histidine kinase